MNDKTNLKLENNVANPQTTTTSSHKELIKARKEAIKEAKSEPEIKWLTEHSRQFLSSGYLTEGTTPEARIREIADNAERILKIDGFADKFIHCPRRTFGSAPYRRDRGPAGCRIPGR